MVIDRIDIHAFGALHRRELTFDAGPNIIEGENESGKTTVAAFIRFLFYGFSDSEEAARYFAFADGALSGSLECTVTGEDGAPLHCRISRVLEPTSEDLVGQVHVQRMDTGEPLYEGCVPGEVFFGVSAEVFSSTAFVQQLGVGGSAAELHATGGAAVGVSTLQDAVTRILYAANEELNPQSAAKALTAQRDRLYNPDTGRGTISDMEKERAALDARRTAAMQAAVEDDRHVLRTAVAECKARIADSQTQITRLTEICARVRRYQAVSNTDRLDELQLRRTSAEKRVTTLCDMVFRSGYIPDADYTAALYRCAAEMREAAGAQTAASEALRKLEFSARRDNVKEDLLRKVELDGGVEQLQQHTDRLRTHRTVSTLCGVLFMIFAVIVMVVTLFFLYLRADVTIRFVPVVVLLCAFSAGFFIMRARYAKELDALLVRYHCETDDELENFFEEYQLSEGRFHQDSAEKESVRSARSAANLRYSEAVREAVRLLSRLQPPGTQMVMEDKLSDTMLEKAAKRIDTTLAEVHRMNAQIAACDAEILALAADNGIEAATVAEALPALATVRSQLCKSFNGIAADALSTTQAEAQLAALQKSLDDDTQQLAALEKQLGTADGDRKEPVRPHADPQVLTALLDELDAHLISDRRTYAALNLAIDKLQSACVRLHDAIAPQLLETTGLLMQSLSERKYSVFGVDDSQRFTYRASADGAAKMFPVDYLSAGTQDLAYLCLRMALTHRMFPREMPPLLFDEAFTTLDDRRLQRMIALLFSATAPDVTGVSTEQALIFTCHERERKAAEAVHPCRVVRL